MILQALIASGATEFRVNYDGGYDEGFAHPERIFYHDEASPVHDVAVSLANRILTLQLCNAVAATVRHDPGYGKMDNVKAALTAIDELAEDLAARLLGDGYGTGEYQLYGSFTANLQTGEIVDHPDASKPLDMM